MLQGPLLGSAVYANVELELGCVSKATYGNILQIGAWNILES